VAPRRTTPRDTRLIVRRGRCPGLAENPALMMRRARHSPGTAPQSTVLDWLRIPAARLPEMRRGLGRGTHTLTCWGVSGWGRGSGSFHDQNRKQ
jgi:hypothetical protein